VTSPSRTSGSRAGCSPSRRTPEPAGRARNRSPRPAPSAACRPPERPLETDAGTARPPSSWQRGRATAAPASRREPRASGRARSRRQRPDPERNAPAARLPSRPGAAARRREWLPTRRGCRSLRAPRTRGRDASGAPPVRCAFRATATRDQTLRTTTLPGISLTSSFASGRGAGPPSTSPSRSKRAPWQGQKN